MNLLETIYVHAKALPAELQRETLDFIEYLEQRYRVAPPSQQNTDTEGFITRFAGSLGADFPDDISDADMGVDAPRESLE